MKTYVRLTFRPAGAKRDRTVWAIKQGPGRYTRCDRGGDTDLSAPEGVSRIEVILTAPGEGKEVPARMNLTYALLETDTEVVR